MYQIKLNKVFSKCVVPRRNVVRRIYADIRLVHRDGSVVHLNESTSIVGSGASAQIPLQGGPSEHAKLEVKGGRLFCTAIGTENNADDLFASTQVWLNGTELRCNVSYMVAPGNELSFGKEENAFIAEFEVEQSPGAQSMSTMLMKGLAQQASPEVQKVITESLDNT